MFFIPQTIHPERLLSWFMQEHGEKEIKADEEKKIKKKKADKLTDQNNDHDTNKYKCSHGYQSVILCVCIISRWNVPH